MVIHIGENEENSRPTKILYCNSLPFAVLQLRMSADTHRQTTKHLETSECWMDGRPLLCGRILWNNTPKFLLLLQL